MSGILSISSLLPEEITNYEIIQYLPLEQIQLPLDDPLLFLEFKRRIPTKESLNFLLTLVSLDDVPEQYLDILPYQQQKELFNAYFRRRDYQSANRLVPYLDADVVEEAGFSLEPQQIQRLVLDYPQLYLVPFAEEYANTLMTYPLENIRDLRNALPMFTIFADYAPQLLDTYYGNNVSQRLLDLILAIASRRAGVDYETQIDLENLVTGLLEEDPEMFWQDLVDVDVMDDQWLTLIQRLMYDREIRPLMNEVVRIYSIAKETSAE